MIFRVEHRKQGQGLLRLGRVLLSRSRVLWKHALTGAQASSCDMERLGCDQFVSRGQSSRQLHAVSSGDASWCASPSQELPLKAEDSCGRNDQSLPLPLGQELRGAGGYGEQVQCPFSRVTSTLAGVVRFVCAWVAYFSIATSFGGDKYADFAKGFGWFVERLAYRDAQLRLVIQVLLRVMRG